MGLAGLMSAGMLTRAWDWGSEGALRDNEESFLVGKPIWFGFDLLEMWEILRSDLKVWL